MFVTVSGVNLARVQSLPVVFNRIEHLIIFCIGVVAGL